jgi:hypothetical protein
MATALVLAGIGALHVAWGLGASFPFRDRAALADTVVGNDSVPGRGASLAVAGLLGLAAGLVADLVPLPAPLRRVGVAGVATALAGRAAFGFAGRTDRLVRGSNSPRFAKADRRVYAPLCAALAAGVVVSVTESAT